MSDRTNTGYFHDQPWSPEALCAQTDPDAFFPERGTSAADPKRICRRCPVKADCLEWALDRPKEPGVYGATTYVERKRIRKQRKVAAEAAQAAEAAVAAESGEVQAA